MEMPANPTKPSDFPYTTIGELTEGMANKHGDKDLIIENESGRSLSYKEADKKSDTVAAALAEMGIRKGDVVATLMVNSIDHALLMLGCLKRGAIFSAINAEFKRDDLRNAIIDINPEAFVLDSKHKENYTAIRNQIDITTEIIRGDTLESAEPLDTLFTSSEPAEFTVYPSDPGVILFTGGTTGRPKPVLNPHFGTVAGAYRYKESWDPDPDDIFLTFGQLFHVAGQQYGVVGPMVSGITCILPQRFSASNYWDWVNEHEATIIDAGGDLQDALLAAHPDPVENPARKSLAVGKTDTNLRFKERFGIEEMLEAWAMTEVGGVNLTFQPFEPAEGTGKPIGSGGKWTEIAIMDEEGGQLPPGSDNVGEIHVRPTVAHTFMQEYYNYPEKTVETWQNLWLSTGDMGYIDEAGTVYFVGREIDHLRRFGENFSAQEVEMALQSHPAVDEAGIVPVPNETISGDDAKAYIVTADEDDPAPMELIEWVEQRLADFKVPRYIEFVNELPRGEAKQQIKRTELADRGIGDAWDRDSS